jgi:hypothetical protein
MCVAVALLVIAFIPGSPVSQDLPAGAVQGLHPVRGVTVGVAVDRSGWIPFGVEDASLAQRLLHLLVTLPGLILVAEIGRRLAKLLRIAQLRDPFTAATARELWRLGKLTTFAGLGAWSSARSRRDCCLPRSWTLSRRTNLTNHHWAGSRWA